MVRNKRVQIYFIMVFLLGAIIFAQDKPVKKNEDQQLREEILAAYKSGGEKDLGDFIKKKKDKISNQFIVDFAKAGVNERKGEWLKACKILAEEKKNEKTRADVLYQTGDYFRLISDKKEAANYYDRALPIYLKLNDPVGQGNVYFRKGEIYSDTGDNSRALEMYDKALPFFEKAGHPVGQGDVYYSKGYIYLRIGKNSMALEMFDKALTFYEKAGHPAGQGNVYKGKGRIHLRIGENSKALEMYDKALIFYKKAGRPLGQGHVYLGKGVIYSYLGEYSKALEMFDKALPFYKKVEDHNGLGSVHFRKGIIYSLTGDNSRALKMYDKALILYEKVGRPIGQGNVYGSKGNVYKRICEFSRAIEMYNKALTFFEKAGEPIGQGNVYWGKGDIYRSTGDDSKALEMFDKALIFFEKAGFTLGQGSVYLEKGIIYSYTGDYSKVLEMYDKALTFYAKVGDPVGQGNVYQYKGDICFNSGDNSRALEMYGKALAFFEKAGLLYNQGQLYRRKGKIYSDFGENSRALELYDKAMLFYNKTGDVGARSIALHDKAKVLEKVGKKDKALEFFEKGIANLEKMRAQTAFSEMKKNLMETVYEQYEETTLFLLKNQRYDKGLRYAESMRARVFLDRMAEGLVRLDKGLTLDFKQKRDNLVTKLSLLSKKMHQNAGKKQEKKLLELKEQYRKTEREFEDLLVKIRLSNPLYASVRYPQPITVPALQTEVLKKGELLLRYFITPDKLYVFLISREIFKLIPIKLKESEIKNITGLYLRAVAENKPRDINRYGKTLYQKLFKPLESSLQSNNHIIIVPDGELARIPFESLILDKKRSGKPVYLLEKYRVKYVQSASLLSILRKHYHRNNQNNSFVGFGDSVYDYENFKQGKPEQGAITRSPGKEEEIRGIYRSRYARAGGIMDRLPHSGEEIKTIARLFEKESLKSVVLLREQAAEDKAKAVNMKDFAYIHFSCHGLLNENFQSLVLSQLPPDKSIEDGYLTLTEIMNCDFNAKLVVLSACQTGSGKMYKGEGITGLTRAVMYAGTPAVIASLWKVDDRATKELMVKFYRNMLEKNLDKAEALRQAKLELLKEKKYASPLHWSAFVMYGE